MAGCFSTAISNVGETTGDMRPDGFALHRAREAQHHDLVYRHREMIAPELRQPLEERPIRAHGVRDTGVDFIDVDGTVQRRQLEQPGRRSVVARLLRAPLLHLLPAKLESPRQDLGTRLEPFQSRRRAVQLSTQPIQRRCQALELARARPQAEAVGGNGGGGGLRAHHLVERASLSAVDG
jgi:hypothetical protein